MDNTREKLIELLCKVQDYGTKNTCEEWSVTVECKDNETVADHLIANGVTIQKWIPVTERLPDHQLDDINATFLIVVKSKYPFDKDYSYDTDVAFYRDDGKGRLDGCWDALNDWGDGEDYLHVTHWMPLPEPTKGD